MVRAKLEGPMRPISRKFDSLAQAGEKALVTFVTAGDPSLDQLPAILDTLCEAGSDIIELGIPFSDPIADGPTIQASSQRALDRGVRPMAVLEALSRWQNPGAPIVLMGYYNPVLHAGIERFAQAIRDAGASGTIISDLTPEESDAWIATSEACELDHIYLAAPTSTEARLAMVAKCSSGFLYAVSRTGVTGVGSKFSDQVGDLVLRCKAHTNIPICVGFGISKPEHVHAVCEQADGAVVGSSLVDLLASEWASGRGASTIREFVRGLKAGTRP